MLRRLAILFIVGIPFFGEAQSFYAIKRPRNLTVYGGTGTANYFGEMVNPKSVGKVRYNLVLGSEFFLTQRFTVRAEAIWFRIAGSDASANDDRVERNLSFTSNCQELSLGGTFYFLPESKSYYQRLTVNFYAFTGVGLVHFNPKAEYEGKKYPLKPLMTENVDYSRTTMVVPYGLGVRFRASPLLNVLIEGGFRKTFSDYLDDVSSHRYVDPTLLSSDLSRTLADRRRERDPDYPALYTVGVRGNPKYNDGYFLMNVKVQYYLPTEIGANSKFRKAYHKKRKAFNPKRK
jgi:Domain of unknown function (DUF6089)